MRLEKKVFWRAAAFLAAGFGLTGTSAETVPSLKSLVRAFDQLAQSDGGSPDIGRTARIGAELHRQLPDFYGSDTDSSAYERRVEAALRSYPAIRARFLATAATIERHHGAATQRFRRVFPRYRPEVPVYVLHALGELDGATRIIDGRVALVFGADVIATIHDDATIGPLVDHELFHSYHRPLLGECDTVWCALWAEGLATYVAARLNPGASDRALLLEFPKPIRPALAARVDEAVCLTLARLDSSAPGDLRGFFAANGSLNQLPARFGYLIGLEVAGRMGKQRSLEALARLDRATVRRDVEAQLRAMSRCPASE